VRLFDLIMQAEGLVDAIASHPEYRLLQDNEHLTDLDFTLGDVELFLMQLNKALGQATESQAGSGSLPTFEQLFDEDSLSNSLKLLEPTISPINSLDELLEERGK
jgi:hypothetical protein